MDDVALEFLDRLDAYWHDFQQSPNLNAWIAEAPGEVRQEVASELLLADLELRYKQNREKLKSQPAAKVELLAANYLKYPAVVDCEGLLEELIEEEFFLRARDQSELNINTLAPSAARLTALAVEPWGRRFAEVLSTRHRLVVRLLNYGKQQDEALLKHELGVELEVGRATQREATAPQVVATNPPRMVIAHSRKLTISRTQALLKRVGYQQLEIENCSQKVPLQIAPYEPPIKPQQRYLAEVPCVLVIGQLQLSIVTAQSLKRG